MHMKYRPWRYGNCLIHALIMWVRFGGYLVVRKSRHGWWPHFMWAKDLGDTQIVEFTPEKKVLLSDLIHVPPPIFKGYVRYGKD